MDTEIGCFMKPEVGYAETKIQPRVQDRGGSSLSGSVGCAREPADLGVHENVLRKWVKELGSDPVQEPLPRPSDR